jgi:hypothetical protein
MNNIVKIENGIVFNNIEYKFQSYVIDEQNTEIQYEILDETQYQIGTDNGIIFFDITTTIDNLNFETSNACINYLYN